MPISVQDLTVSYRHHPAIHHINVQFEEARAYAIFGPNGAGKSTLLKAMMGLVKADTGRVAFQQLQRQDIAYLPQQSDVDRSQPMTVFELAAMGLWNEIGFFGRVNKAQKVRVHEALQRVSMDSVAHKNIGALSNGQFQRVLFARMLVQNARFLLLDEPFNAVDAATTFALLEVLQQCLKQGKAVVAVLHDYEQVRAYFPNTVMIAREVIACGKTEQVLTDANLQAAFAALQTGQANKEWCEVPQNKLVEE